MFSIDGVSCSLKSFAFASAIGSDFEELSIPGELNFPSGTVIFVVVSLLLTKLSISTAVKPNPVPRAVLSNPSTPFNF